MRARYNIIFRVIGCSLFCYFLSAELKAQSPGKFTPLEIWDSGLPNILNFEAKDYKSNPQNWCFLEGENGLLYVGNTRGVLEFDGAQWNTISLTNSSLVRSLAKTDEGTIYVGGVREMGYLEADSLGRLQYTSLLPMLDSAYHDFTDVWNTSCLGDDIFFGTNQYLFKWDGKSFKVWRAQGKFGEMFTVHGRLFVQSKPEGILTLENETLQLIPDGDYFNQTLGKITDMQPLADGSVLVAYSYTGLYKYANQEFTPIYLNPSFFEKTPLYRGDLLYNGDYAAATMGQGVYVFDIEGAKIKRVLQKKHGLISDVIFSIYTSSDGSLWVGTDNGISKVDIASPLRKFDQGSGLDERVRGVFFHNHNLYVGSNGLYYLDTSKTPAGLAETMFKKVKGLETNARTILPVEGEMFYFTGSFVYSINEQNQIRLVEKIDDAFVSSIRSKIDNKKIYIGSQRGNLYEIRKTGKDWKLQHLTQIDGEIFLLAEDSRGALWISTQYNGLYRISGLAGEEMPYEITHFTEKDGLPSLVWNLLYAFNDKIYLGNDGMFTYDTITGRFFKDTVLMKGYHKEVTDFGPMGADHDGNIWQTVREGLQNKIYKIDSNLPKELAESNLFTEFNTYNIHAADDIVFFSGPSGIIAYNNNMASEEAPITGLKVRRVKLKNDSLIYPGPNGKNLLYQFPIKNNSLVFHYALADYKQPESNKYQYRLADFDDNWSDWTYETKANYTNLPEGDYQFQVRAKNVFGQVSNEDTFSFSVLPPWHRSWWAYLGYILCGGLVIWGFTIWRSRNLQRKNLILEGIIRKRTEEIRQKNKQLGYQTEKLKEMDTMKTRLFANISHEFRTPLTLIKGPIEKLEENGENNLSTTDVKMIRRNTTRLLKLVNQLLDLSKLDSGKLELNQAEGDLFRCLRAAASVFSSHAASRNIDYQIGIPSRQLWTTFDRDKVEKIVYNLLSNAFKFTEDGGKIVIEADHNEDHIQLKVADNGAGIAADKLPLIFDRFFQVDDSYTKEESGTGIGLALTKELVELMGGRISVKSKSGHGSIFKIVVPIEEIQSPKLPQQESPELDGYGEQVSARKSTSTQTEKTRILLIEDNNDMRYFIREQLQRDYQLAEATNGKQGLKMAKDLVPELIITDLMMPQMDGITLCKKLKSDLITSHIPVVMLTAKAALENKLEGLETGADEYLTKPFNARELKIRVRNLIESRRKLRKRFSKNINVDPVEITVTSIDERFLSKLLELLEQHHSDPSFGVPQMQQAMAMSKAGFHSKVKALTDQPPGELLRNFRLKRSAQLLSQDADNISQIAYDVGFNSLSYFTRCFKHYYGITPSDYIMKSRK